MKDRQGPVGRVATLVGAIGAAARRRQQGREPRVVLYDRAGHARALQPSDPGYDALLERGAELVGLAGRP